MSGISLFMHACCPGNPCCDAGVWCCVVYLFVFIPALLQTQHSSHGRNASMESVGAGFCAGVPDTCLCDHHHAFDHGNIVFSASEHRKHTSVIGAPACVMVNP